MPTRTHDRCIYFSSGIPKSTYALSRERGNVFSINFGEYGEFPLLIIWDRDQATYQLTVNKPGLYLNKETEIPEGQPIVVHDDAIICPPADQNPKQRQLLFKITDPEEMLTLEAGNPHERYCLGELLRGKRIFKAKDARLKVDVVLKFVDENTAETLEIPRFAKAAGIMPQVHSPHIARIQDVRRWSLPIDGNISYFVCREYMPGESLDILVLRRALEHLLGKGAIEPTTGEAYLDDYTKRKMNLDEIAQALYPNEGTRERIWQDGKLEVDDAVDIMLQVCRAIEALHAKGITHSNLDPTHIIVGEDRYTKIIGVRPCRAGSEVPLTLSGEIPGSSPFAPQEFAGTISDDIYALGAIFHWAITGALLPKEGPIPDLPEEVPQEVREIIRRSLCLQASERPNAVEMVDAFEKALASLEIGLARKPLLIMSPEIPSIGGIEIGIIYEPLTECSGDFYNILDLGHGRTGIIIGDAGGHEMREAHSAGMVRAGLKLMAQNHQTPEAVLFNTNRLIRCPGRAVWATALYGILNRRYGRFQFARAAHCPLLLYQNGSCSLVEPQGIPLGMSSEFSCAEELLYLKENDMLIFFTDGITEAENPQGEPFGILGLIQAVYEHGGKDLQAFLAGIGESLTQFIAGGRLKDDATLIAVRIVEEEETQCLFYPLKF